MRECSVAQSCLTLRDPMDCSPPGSSIHRISQTRILQWVAISSSMGFSQPRDPTCMHLLGLLPWQADSLLPCHLESPGVYIIHILNFLGIMMFWYLKKPFWLFMGAIAPSGSIQFLDMARTREHQTWFVWCKQTSPEPHNLSWAHKPPEAIFLYQNHPRTRCQAAAHHPYSLEPTEIIQIS